MEREVVEEAARLNQEEAARLDSGEARLEEAATLLSYQYIINWAVNRLAAREAK